MDHSHRAATSMSVLARHKSANDRSFAAGENVVTTRSRGGSLAGDSTGSAKKESFIPSMRHFIPESLTGREIERISHAYSLAGLTDNPTAVRSFLLSLGQELTEDAFMKAIKGLVFREGVSVPLEVIIRIMGECKREHSQIVSAEEVETIEAFVALGGHADESGEADIQPLINASIEFNVNDELRSMVEGRASKDEDGTMRTFVPFEHFKNIFSHIRFVFSGFASPYRGIDAGTPAETDLELPEHERKKERKSKTQFMEVKEAQNTHRVSGSARGMRSSRNLNADVSWNDDEDDSDEEENPLLGAIAETIDNHYEFLDAIQTPRTRAVLEGTFSSTLKVMNQKGELGKGKAPPAKFGVTPLMVIRERRREKEMVASFRDSVDRSVDDLMSRGTNSSIQYRAPLKLGKGHNNVKRHRAQSATPVPSLTAQPRRDENKAIDDFVRGVARQADRQRVAKDKEAAKVVHRSVVRAKRKERRHERETVAHQSFHDRGSTQPVAKYRTLQLRVASDFTREKPLTCSVSSYTELVRAVASVVKPLPVGHFVAEVWAQQPESKSYVPITTLDELPRRGAVRAMIYSPPTTLQPLGAAALPSLMTLSAGASKAPSTMDDKSSTSDVHPKPIEEDEL